MATLIIITSPLGNSHNAIVKNHDEFGRVMEEQLIKPGESASMSIAGGDSLSVSETMKKSLEGKE